jgi:hypothetical protein
MAIMLGNLTVEDMQQRLGSEFPAELIEYMKERHQQYAQVIEAGKWHCFDVPFTVVCGDMDTAQEIYRHLSPLASSFKQSMQIAIDKRSA